MFTSVFHISDMSTCWPRNSRSFDAMRGPFTLWEVLFTLIHADSRAQNLCTEIGTLQYVEQMKHLFSFLKVATNQIWIG